MNFVREMFTTGKRRADVPWVSPATKGLAFGIAIWSVYQSIFSDIDVMAMTIIFLSLNLCLCFLLVTPSRNSRTDHIPILDFVCAAIALGAGIHFGLKLDVIATRIALFDDLTPADIFFASATALLILEAARRTVGSDMAALTVLFFIYNLWGPYMPSIIRHNGVSYLHFLDVSFFTTDGVFGVPLRVAATFAFLFVVFGTLLARCGGGEFFYRLAASVSGRQAGGSAKVAVVSSGLFGSVSGNPVADVMTTGSVTIPIMIRSGFKPVIAAAIEATASNGGSIVPPVMGAAAFIMAEFTGITYSAICIAAIIPALLYYTSLYAQVHFYSRQHGLVGMTKDQLPRFWATIRADAPFLIPLAVLLTVLARGYSPSMVAFSASLAVIFAATLRPATRMSLKTIYGELAEASERMLPVAITCAAAGLILAGMTMTGLANKFSEVIATISSGNIIIALICAAVLTNLLGLGLPTSGTYILAAVLVGGILVKMGVSLLQAHMYILYFAAMSALTPPVAISAYSAAALAKTNPFTTSLYAMRKATVAFLVPFGFVLHSELLMKGTWIGIILYTAAAIIGVIFLAAAFERFLIRKLTGWEASLLSISGFLLLVGNYEMHVAGLLVGAFALFRPALELNRKRRAAPSKEQMVEPRAFPSD